MNRTDRCSRRMSCQGDEEDVFSRHVLTCSVIDAEETGSDGVKQDAGC